MSDKFAAFILTHGRPDHVVTYAAIRKHGYTGRVVILVDDEDETLEQYRAKFGAQVQVFSKEAIAQTFDEGDNFGDRRTVVYARNAAFEVARELGLESFVQLDDDYTSFYYSFNRDGIYGRWRIPDLDWMFAAMVEYLKETPFASVAMSQGGDHLGGNVGGYQKSIRSFRKAMNSFVCLTDRPFQFTGRINEDVNTYTASQRRGTCFLTFHVPKLIQVTTQANEGGMTDIYLDSGTYVKSFYSVMYAPSGVRIELMKSKHPRIHHRINWRVIAPKILRETERKRSRVDGT